MYVCDVCQMESSMRCGKDAAKCMQYSKEKGIMLHLYEFVLSERQN